MITTNDTPDSAADLLDAAYKQLEFDQGSLLSAARAPQLDTIAEWVEPKRLAEISSAGRRREHLLCRS